jgi:hypothetical protein
MPSKVFDGTSDTIRASRTSFEVSAVLCMVAGGGGDADRRARHAAQLRQVVETVGSRGSSHALPPGQ